MLRTDAVEVSEGWPTVLESLGSMFCREAPIHFTKAVTYMLSLR